MKWNFEISDVPKNPAYPVIGFQTFDNGAKKGPFYFTMDDFLTALQNKPESQHNSDFLENSTPTLPFGTIRYSVNITGTRQHVFIEIPQKKWTIQHEAQKDTYFPIGFPRMVIRYSVTSLLGVSEMKIDETRIYAVLNDNKPITDNTRLYTFPYPNVYKDNGVVCWGQNTSQTIKDIVELERMFRWFVSAPFNDELGVRTVHGIPMFKQLIKEIQDKPFNDDWLLPTNTSFYELFDKQESL